jgi:hypothetical protein
MTSRDFITQLYILAAYIPTSPQFQVTKTPGFNQVAQALQFTLPCSKGYFIFVPNLKISGAM